MWRKISLFLDDMCECCSYPIKKCFLVCLANEQMTAAKFFICNFYKWQFCNDYAWINNTDVIHFINWNMLSLTGQVNYYVGYNIQICLDLIFASDKDSRTIGKIYQNISFEIQNWPFINHLPCDQPESTILNLASLDAHNTC